MLHLPLEYAHGEVKRTEPLQRYEIQNDKHDESCADDNVRVFGHFD